MAISQQLLEILVCPKDRGPLDYIASEDVFYNPRLRLKYRIEGGNIPVLLVDEAETVDDAEHDRLVKMK